MKIILKIFCLIILSAFIGTCSEEATNVIRISIVYKSTTYYVDENNVDKYYNFIGYYQKNGESLVPFTGIPVSGATGLYQYTAKVEDVDYIEVFASKHHAGDRITIQLFRDDNNKKVAEDAVIEYEYVAGSTINYQLDTDVYYEYGSETTDTTTTDTSTSK